MRSRLPGGGVGERPLLSRGTPPSRGARREGAAPVPPPCPARPRLPGGECGAPGAAAGFSGLPGLKGKPSARSRFLINRETYPFFDISNSYFWVAYDWPLSLFTGCLDRLTEICVSTRHGFSPWPGSYLYS